MNKPLESLPAEAPVAHSKPKAPGRRTQVQRRSEAEASMLEAAQAIVARKGWVGMTLAEVGLAAGYSRGLAAHHFGTKPRLLQALAMHIGQNFLVSIAPNAKKARPGGMRAILQFVRAYLGSNEKQWINNRALLILMAESTTDESEAGPNLADYNRRSCAYLARLFDEGKAAGEVREDTDSTSAAVVVLSTMRGIMLQRLQKHSEIDLPAVRRQALTMTIRAWAHEPEKWLEMVVPDQG